MWFSKRNWFSSDQRDHQQKTMSCLMTRLVKMTSIRNQHPASGVFLKKVPFWKVTSCLSRLRLRDFREDEDCQAATENDEKLNSSDSNIKPHQEADTTPEGNSSRSIKSIDDPASAGEVQGDPRTQVQTSVSRLLDEEHLLT